MTNPINNPSACIDVNDDILKNSMTTPMPKKTQSIAYSAIDGITIHYHFVGDTKSRSNSPWSITQKRLKSYVHKRFSVLDVQPINGSVYSITLDSKYSPNNPFSALGYSGIAVAILNDLQQQLNSSWCNGDRIDVIFPGPNNKESRATLT
jgi:hypothetical protein